MILLLADASGVISVIKNNRPRTAVRNIRRQLAFIKSKLPGVRILLQWVPSHSDVSLSREVDLAQSLSKNLVGALPAISLDRWFSATVPVHVVANELRHLMREALREDLKERAESHPSSSMRSTLIAEWGCARDLLKSLDAARARTAFSLLPGDGSDLIAGLGCWWHMGRLYCGKCRCKIDALKTSNKRKRKGDEDEFETLEESEADVGWTAIVHHLVSFRCAAMVKLL
ncbi:unnamed protein product, partial [Amoebophrya sp. A120]|eukprot:GSA120T00003555001.1